MTELDAIVQRFLALKDQLDERSLRLLAAAESQAIGHGGISAVSRATGISRPVIARGIEELRHGTAAPAGRIRRPGGGRKRAIVHDAGLHHALESLFEPAGAAATGSPLRWTSKSVRHLAQELSNNGHPVSHRVVADLLHETGYNLQANRAVHTPHLDRNSQFEYTNEKVRRYLQRRQPVLFVDIKRRKLAGDRWSEMPVNDDTAGFALDSLRRWWSGMGQNIHPHASQLLVVVDARAGQAVQVHLKRELQMVADESGLQIAVSCLPPGTSKWNRIEQRLFSVFTQNWNDKPLVQHEISIHVITPDGSADQRMADIHLPSNHVNDEWNYAVLPKAMQSMRSY